MVEGEIDCDEMGKTQSGSTVSMELTHVPKPGSTEEERASSCGWVLRCSWDNGFVRITSQPQGAIPVGTAVAGRPPDRSVRAR